MANEIQFEGNQILFDSDMIAMHADCCCEPTPTPSPTPTPTPSPTPTATPTPTPTPICDECCNFAPTTISVKIEYIYGGVTECTWSFTASNSPGDRCVYTLNSGPITPSPAPPACPLLTSFSAILCLVGTTKTRYNWSVSGYNRCAIGDDGDCTFPTTTEWNYTSPCTGFPTYTVTVS